MSTNTTKITQLAWYMPNSREFSMQFNHQRFPSSALTEGSIYILKNLFGINGWRPLVTYATVCIYKFNEIHAIVGEMLNCTEFSMQFYIQRFPSSALIDRSIYTLKNLFRNNSYTQLTHTTKIIVYISNEEQS